jgi:predicted nucleic acid-binding Zn ribbon protein
MKLKCPVCEKGIITDPFGECLVCGWLDDPFQELDPDMDRCNNTMSLNQARKAWKEGRKIE